MERKIIKLRRLRGGYRVYISSQSHIQNEFGAKGSKRFIASNGMMLISYFFPAIATDNKVFVRGSTTLNNNKILDFRTHSNLERFIETVKEYNEYFSSGTLVPTFNCTCKDAILCEECIKDPKKAVTF